MCNREVFGYIPPLTKSSFGNNKESFIYLKIEHLLHGVNKSFNQPLPITKNIDSYLMDIEKTKMGFDEIYIINLERRKDRRERIERTLNDLGLSFKTIKAVDGKNLTQNMINEMGIEILPNYKDPYTGRSMTFGEIGCFLSHYNIWKEVNYASLRNKMTNKTSIILVNLYLDS